MKGQWLKKEDNDFCGHVYGGRGQGNSPHGVVTRLTHPTFNQSLSEWQSFHWMCLNYRWWQVNR